VGTDASRANRDFYGRAPAGQRDYWRKMAAPRHRVATLVAELRRDRPGRVVDLGCGDGAMLDEIARALPDAELAGIDLSDAQIELNRAARPETQWHQRDLDGDVTFGAELEGAFDAILASEVIEHLDRPGAFLTSARRLAQTGARLYLSTQSGPVRETERRVGHRRHYSTEEMTSLLGETGWRPIRVWNTGFPFHDLSKWYANRDPDGSMDRFGEQAYGTRENLICWALRQAFRFNSRRRGAQLFAVAERP
jgi:SAM-dependent methyltransferase